MSDLTQLLRDKLSNAKYKTCEEGRYFHVGLDHERAKAVADELDRLRAENERLENLIDERDASLEAMSKTASNFGEQVRSLQVRAEELDKYEFKLFESPGIERCDCEDGTVSEHLDEGKTILEHPCPKCTRPSEERGYGWVVKQERQVGIGLVERARKRGIELQEPPDSQREIDRMSGKRIASEE